MKTMSSLLTVDVYSRRSSLRYSEWRSHWWVLPSPSSVFQAQSMLFLDLHHALNLQRTCSRLSREPPNAPTVIQQLAVMSLKHLLERMIFRMPVSPHPRCLTTVNEPGISSEGRTPHFRHFHALHPVPILLLGCQKIVWAFTFLKGF